ncbi:ATP-binding protein [Streptomyces chartreusis]|uniref:ATP-binding protein n=1 Tax=Streptomyces chartreusis TaxID=1969 RepID=UPI00364D55DD
MNSGSTRGTGTEPGHKGRRHSSARTAGPARTHPPSLIRNTGLEISTADFAARAFTCHPDSLKTIRRFILETISTWGLHALADDLTTVVNELTTNAVQHALPHPGNA